MSYFNKILAQFDPSNMGPFGDLTTTDLTAITQFDFVYGINNQVGVTAASGTGSNVDTNLSRLRVQSGTSPQVGSNIGSSASFTSLKPARYRAGQGIVARFTGVYGSAQAGNIQEIGMATTGDGYMFAYNGTAFGIIHRNSSTGTKVENFYTQSSWNGDTCDGNGPSGFNWNQQNGCVMMIKYPYLGYGNILFFVEDGTSSRIINVHTIQYNNSSPNVELGNPTLNFWARTANTGGNSSNVTMYVGSVGVFLSGQRIYTTAQFGIDNQKVVTTTSETNVLSLKTATTYNGVANRGMIRLRSISTAAYNTPISTLRIKKNPTTFFVSGTSSNNPTYSTISGVSIDNGTTITSGNSIVSYATMSGTFSGGTIVFNATSPINASTEIDLTSYDIFILPGEVVTLSVQNTLASTTSSVAINWQEDI